MAIFKRASNHFASLFAPATEVAIELKAVGAIGEGSPQLLMSIGAWRFGNSLQGREGFGNRDRTAKPDGLIRTGYCAATPD
jgi:hypothetical protein